MAERVNNPHTVVAPAVLFIVLACALVVSCVIGSTMGSSTVGVHDVIALCSGSSLSEGARNILVNVRIPRVCAALLAGCALACSGAVIQAVLRNPLASPNVLGINSGAGFFVLLASALFPAAFALIPVAAFCGALVAACGIFIISIKAKGSQLSVILAGMATTTIFGAGMNIILIVNPDAYVGSSTFLVGGLAGVSFEDLIWPLVYVIGGLIASVCMAQRLNILALGDENAHALGMSVLRIRITSLGIAAILAGSAVSFAGLLGFVGLIIPHIVRGIVGHDNRIVLPGSMMLGSVFVILCDVLSRTMFAPYEIPVGITMACIGGPFFIYLIIKQRGHNLG